MNDDYLWDRTGKPDPEIQQLEEILGELRYQPRPLVIPAELQVRRKQSFFRDFGPRLAIAATIAMFVVGLGVWFAVQRMQRIERGEPVNVAVTQPSPAPVDQVNPTPAVSNDGADKRLAVNDPKPVQKETVRPRVVRVNRPLLAANANRHRNTAVANELTARQREGEAAKNQLMLALRLASAKLNYAQKKTQVVPRDQIHNQHKIG